MAEYTIGLDLGGTNLRAAAIDRSGKVLEKLSGSTTEAGSKLALLGEMAAVIDKLRANWGAGGLAGIGVGVPGFILLKEGRIMNSNNLAFLEGSPIRDEMESLPARPRDPGERRQRRRPGREVDGRRPRRGRPGAAHARHGHRRRHHHRRPRPARLSSAWPANSATSPCCRTATRAAAAIAAAWKSTPPPPPSRPWRACCNWATTSRPKEVYELRRRGR